MASIYEVKLTTETLGQGMLNRFYYLAEGALENPQSVGEFFALQVLPYIMNIMGDGAAFKRASVTNVLNANDTAVAHGNIPGTIPGEEIASFFAQGFTLYPASGNFRAGAKRFGGASETGIVDNVPSSGLQALLDLVGGAIATALVIDAGTYIRPGLAREIDPTSWLFSQLLSAVFTRFTTQDTRKDYRGGGPVPLWLGGYDMMVNFEMAGSPSDLDAGLSGSDIYDRGDLNFAGAPGISTSGASTPSSREDTLSGVVEADGTFTPE